MKSIVLMLSGFFGFSGILSAVAPSLAFPVYAQDAKLLSCEFRMFQADQAYTLPYKFDTAEIRSGSVINDGSYLIYSFTIKSNTQDRKSLTQMLFKQLTGAAEPLDIIAIRPQNGTCKTGDQKNITCDTSYSYTESALYPIDVLVKVRADTLATSTSSKFEVTTTQGTTVCANLLRIKAPLRAVNPVRWETPYALLASGDFTIRIGKQTFYGKDAVTVKSDAGVDKTTLEVTWVEHGVEMRLYLYFRKKPSNMWELYEMRSYDGNPKGEWILYKDSLENATESLIGYHAYADSRAFVAMDGSGAQITCASCEFNAFMAAVPPITPYGYSLEPLIGLPSGQMITISTDPQNGYGVNVVLRDASGQIVVDQKDFSYEWASDHSEVARIAAGSMLFADGTCAYGVQAPCPMNHVDISGIQSGQSTIQVKVTRKSDGALVAQTSFPVKVVNLSQIQSIPTPLLNTTMSPQDQDLLRVKRDVAKLSRELEVQKQSVSALEQIVISIKRFLSSVFGRSL